jgi:inorganic pyrophosphatase
MATSLVPTSEESDELVILVMNTDFATSKEIQKDKDFHKHRNEEIDKFFKHLLKTTNTKPDFFLLQEVKETVFANGGVSDQREAIVQVLQRLKHVINV